MSVENIVELLPFREWFSQAAIEWLVIVGFAAVGMLLVALVVCLIRMGPVAAFSSLGRTLTAGLVDLVRMSPRRVLAMSWLAVKESIRRRVVVVFAIFILILLFAGWFLDPSSSQPARLYLSFVLTATSYLVLLLALFLSALSLPADIKNKTLHTIVTKPVRPSEIVLGRILGFVAVGTLLLAIMGPISYGFVVRGLSHTHQLTAENLQPIQRGTTGEMAGFKGRTSEVRNHTHQATIDENGNAWVSTEQGHKHELTVHRSGDKTTYELGPPEGMLVARVPIYGKIRFKDRAGKDAEKGVNVGDEWTYRSFLEGGSNAAAVWTFSDVTPARFPEDKFPTGLPLELNIEVFRTHKGDMSDPEKVPGILGSISLRNPKTGETVDDVRIFEARDFATDTQYIPRKIETPDGKTIDLFKDLVADGKVEVSLKCVPRAQYFGAAQADVYLRANDASFAINFLKGYLGVWLQMVVVIGIGVMFSTFLSGPVAMIATLGVLIGGFFTDFMSQLASGEAMGGGPFESAIRLVTQENMVSPLEPGLQTNIAQMLDTWTSYPMAAAAAVLPKFGTFDFSSYVAYGFDISSGLILQCLCRALAFLVPVFIASYFFLKTREVAR